LFITCGAISSGVITEGIILSGVCAFVPTKISYLNTKLLEKLSASIYAMNSWYFIFALTGLQDLDIRGIYEKMVINEFQNFYWDSHETFASSATIPHTVRLLLANVP